MNNPIFRVVDNCLLMERRDKPGMAYCLHVVTGEHFTGTPGAYPPADRPIKTLAALAQAMNESVEAHAEQERRSARGDLLDTFEGHVTEARKADWR